VLKLTHICKSVFVSARQNVCVCVSERERERQTDRQSVCMYVSCMCVRGRDRYVVCMCVRGRESVWSVCECFQRIVKFFSFSVRIHFLWALLQIEV